MSLPSKWIDKIFEKLIIHYGRDFTSRWEGLDLNAVKDDWAYELAGFERHPKSILYALGHFDFAKPPTVRQFRDLARKCPHSEDKQIPLSNASAAVAAEQISRIHLMLKQTKPRGDREWAEVIIKRHAAGEKINPTTLRFAREGLRLGS